VVLDVAVGEDLCEAGRHVHRLVACAREGRGLRGRGDMPIPFFYWTPAPGLDALTEEGVPEVLQGQRRDVCVQVRPREDVQRDAYPNFGGDATLAAVAGGVSGLGQTPGIIGAPCGPPPLAKAACQWGAGHARATGIHQHRHQPSPVARLQRMRHTTAVTPVPGHLLPPEAWPDPFTPPALCLSIGK
jgi:hypothetical protein